MWTMVFLEYDTKSKDNKSKNRQVDCTELKSFCIAKDAGWEEIFANHIPDTELISD